MQIIEKKIDEIIPYINNPRNNDAAVETVAASIKEFGFKQPIVIDKDGVIVAGHTRHKAAKRLGLATVPCIMADDLTEQQIKAYRLADNKVAELATWDMETLEIELEQITELEMIDFGFEPLEDNEKPTKEREDLSADVESMYQVIIECNDETEQEEVFTKLKNEGYSCRVLTL